MICPVCKQPLHLNNISMLCPNKHCYDIAAGGYVNLLLANQKKSASPGDNKQMVLARQAFLSKGYYLPLANAISNMVSQALPNNGAVLDLGCSEGYYTHLLSANLYARQIKAGLFGLDISKDAIKQACKTPSDIQFMVASAFDLPFKSNSLDMVLSVFAPYAVSELARVLKPNASALLVVPGKQHLDGIKKVVYDAPRFEEEKPVQLLGFELKKVQKLVLEVELSCPDDIANLFKMTPYYYKSPLQGKEKLLSQKTLSTTLDIALMLFCKQ